MENEATTAAAIPTFTRGSKRVSRKIRPRKFALKIVKKKKVKQSKARAGLLDSATEEIIKKIMQEFGLKTASQWSKLNKKKSKKLKKKFHKRNFKKLNKKNRKTNPLPYTVA